jgi:hypothetical protein
MQKGNGMLAWIQAFLARISIVLTCQTETDEFGMDPTVSG